MAVLEFTDNNNILICKEEELKYIYLKRTPLIMTRLIKIHKKDASISPIINWENAPCHIKLKIHHNKFKMLYLSSLCTEYFNKQSKGNTT
jgi:hypothetical protein